MSRSNQNRLGRVERATAVYTLNLRQTDFQHAQRPADIRTTPLNAWSKIRPRETAVLRPRVKQSNLRFAPDAGSTLLLSSPEMTDPHPGL